MGKKKPQLLPRQPQRDQPFHTRGGNNQPLTIRDPANGPRPTQSQCNPRPVSTPDVPDNVCRSSSQEGSFTSRLSLTSLPGSRIIHLQLTISSPYMSDLRRKAPHNKPFVPARKNSTPPHPPKMSRYTPTLPSPPARRTQGPGRINTRPPNPQLQVARSSHHTVLPIYRVSPSSKKTAWHPSLLTIIINKQSIPLAKNPATHQNISYIGRRTSAALRLGRFSWVAGWYHR